MRPVIKRRLMDRINCGANGQVLNITHTLWHARQVDRLTTSLTPITSRPRSIRCLGAQFDRALLTDTTRHRNPISEISSTSLPCRRCAHSHYNIVTESYRSKHIPQPRPPLHNPPRRLHFRFTNSRPIHLTAGSNGTLIQLFKSTLPLQSLSESTQHPFGRLPPKEPIRRLLAVAKRISRPTQIRKPATPTQNVNTSIRSVGCVCVCVHQSFGHGHQPNALNLNQQWRSGGKPQKKFHYSASNIRRLVLCFPVAASILNNGAPTRSSKDGIDKQINNTTSHAAPFTFLAARLHMIRQHWRHKRNCRRAQNETKSKRRKTCCEKSRIL